MDVEEADVRVELCDALELDGVRVVVRAVLHADEGDGHVGPGLPEEFELELVHVEGFAVEEDEEREFRHARGGLPAEDGVVAAVAVLAVLVLEVLHQKPSDWLCLLQK